VSRAGATERARLHETFTTLCRIPSVTRDERAVADWLSAELGAIGLAVEEDGAAAEIGGNAGNLTVRIPGQGERWLMLCAHMDTVPLAAPVEPVQRDGGWENANDAILGADNKAAVAVLVEVARRWGGGAGAPAVGLEIVFTVAEENGLHGAKAYDVTSLRSELGYVFDHATALGEIVVASPTHQMLSAEIRGRAAHAGLAPETGRSAIAVAAHAIAAMQLGRLDAETTANIGTISGGTAANVVPDRCRLLGEARALDQERVEQVVTEMIDALQDAADAGECDLDVGVERMFAGYRVRPSSPGVELAGRALRLVGYEPQLVASGGGSDANAFQTAGFSCLNIANGTENPHRSDERVSNAALEDGLELALALAQEAAR
jgi:tripeptide aminopeptidase